MAAKDCVFGKASFKVIQQWEVKKHTPNADSDYNASVRAGDLNSQLFLLALTALQRFKMDLVLEEQFNVTQEKKIAVCFTAA